MSEIPYGFCQCGCGGKTTIAKKTNTRRNQVKGQPLHFIFGHSTRVRDALENPNPSGLCQCGCGQPTAIATITSKRHERVKGLPVRFVRGHGGRKLATDRFWAHVQKSPDGCWIWTGSTTKGGYGIFPLGGRNGCVTTASRFSYTMHFGLIPDSLDVCHNCDNPSCVCPDHLFLGTRKDNMQDALRKGRTKNGTTKLTKQQVLEIRRRYAEGGISQTALSCEYGVARTAINRIIHRKRHAQI